MTSTLTNDDVVKRVVGDLVNGSKHDGNDEIKETSSYLYCRGTRHKRVYGDIRNLHFHIEAREGKDWHTVTHRPQRVPKLTRGRDLNPSWHDIDAKAEGRRNRDGLGQITKSFFPPISPSGYSG